MHRGISADLPYLSITAILSPVCTWTIPVSFPWLPSSPSFQVLPLQMHLHSIAIAINPLNISAYLPKYISTTLVVACIDLSYLNSSVLPSLETLETLKGLPLPRIISTFFILRFQVTWGSKDERNSGVWKAFAGHSQGHNY